MALETGSHLLHYRIVRKLGEGGMGVVYEATDTRLHRNVAIKILPAELTENPERRTRFQQEAQLAAALNHPGIATVYDVGEDGGVHFIAMELVRGRSLRDLVREGPVEAEHALEIAHGIAAGLARAHREGVVHRDLKPDNVMLTDEGQPKILDFGLGKLVQNVRLHETDRPADRRAESTESPTATIVAGDAPGSPQMTEAGRMLGTLAYMSPEQLEGGPVDARSDVFSFGVLFYEMLAGGRPFGGDSTIRTMTAILRDDPPPLETMRRGLSEDVHSVIHRCLAKDPAERFASGQELLEALTALSGIPARPERGRRNMAFRLAAAVVVVGLLAAVGALVWRAQRTSWAHDVALPEIERLSDAGDWDGVMRLVREASAVIPDDPRLLQLRASALFPVSIESEPPGARVWAKGYADTDREWIELGTTPLDEVWLAGPARIRFELDGYLPFEGGMFLGDVRETLYRESEVPAGMVRVPAGAAKFEDAGPVELEAFWIDRHEVTQERFKEFVDDGGYERRELWHEDTPWERVAELFVDSTGRPGPASWELGSFPDGTADHPVHGISWYEADAFARWAGKSLPTVFHWRHAAQQGPWSDVVVVSNFDGEGPAPVGRYPGVGRYGTFDMAGNVSEWCLNSTGSGGRYVLGGGWSDPIYLYASTEAADPLDRSRIHGMRLIRTDGELTAEATAPVEDPVHDFRDSRPIGDEAFEIIRGMYAYDRTPLEPRVESVTDTEHWREEVVSIRAAYGDERIPVHVYLPRNASTPHQTVIYAPGSDAGMVADSSHMRLAFSSFIPRSGRALVYPVYKGTYERRMKIGGQNDIRDRLVYFVKDLRRTVDYLETRDDLDVDKLGFFGLSWGSTYAPVYTSIENRFDAAVLLVGGLYRYPPERPAEAVPLNYTPRVTLPVLMINSRNDFNLPIETNVKAMLAQFGTPPEHKKLALIDGGHVPESPNEYIREALDWFDHYLGPVAR